MKMPALHLTLAALLGSACWVVSAGVEDDLATSARVRTALRADLGLQARYIEVDSYGGTVQLTGPVDSPSAREAAIRCATDVDGVNHVINQLVPQPGFPVLAVN